MFERTFRSLFLRKVNVVYPSTGFSRFDIDPPPMPDVVQPGRTRIIFLVINRYERKKNTRLVIERAHERWLSDY